MQRNLFVLHLTTGVAVTGFFLAGCSSPTRRDRFENQAITTRPAVAMRGESMFFDGKLKAEVTVSRGRSLPAGENEAGGGGRHGGGRHGGGRRHHDEAMMENSSSEEDGDMPVRPIRSMSGSALAVTLRLKLENLSKDALDVQIRDVTSDLGDFAVRPERILLAPDQSGEVDPMVSELGVTSDEIPVTVALVAFGKKDEKVVLVKNLFTPAPQK